MYTVPIYNVYIHPEQLLGWWPTLWWAGSTCTMWREHEEWRWCPTWPSGKIFLSSSRSVLHDSTHSLLFCITRGAAMCVSMQLYRILKIFSKPLGCLFVCVHVHMYVCVSWGHLDVWGELASHKRSLICIYLYMQPGLPHYTQTTAHRHVVYMEIHVQKGR